MAIFLVKFLRCIKIRRSGRRRSTNRELQSDGNRDQEEEIGVGSKSIEMEETMMVRGFCWDELKRAAKDFSRVIGSGGFSNVYLARFPDSSSLAAVKVIQSGGSERLSRVFKQELEILRQIRHDNIVKLLGYCEDREEGALIFEYIPNGTLQEKLHRGRRGDSSPVLSWKDRIVIAFQLAGAIQYLHEKCSLHIVHGDIKASNILLDEQLNCKLCDFGSAKMGFSSMVQPPSSSSSSADRNLMMGSPGYVDPQFLRTGMASKKNDVYSFGVILLELITGMEAFCSEKGQMLTSVAGGDVAQVVKMVDPRLKGNFDLEEVKVMASLAALCLRSSPSLRPSAVDLLLIMRDKIASIYNSFSACAKKEIDGIVCQDL